MFARPERRGQPSAPVSSQVVDGRHGLAAREDRPEGLRVFVANHDVVEQMRPGLPLAEHDPAVSQAGGEGATSP